MFRDGTPFKSRQLTCTHIRASPLLMQMPSVSLVASWYEYVCGTWDIARQQTTLAYPECNWGRTCEERTTQHQEAVPDINEHMQGQAASYQSCVISILAISK